MPWSLKDVSRHTKKATTDAEKRKWVAIANDVLKSDGDEGKAIRIANSKCCESEENTTMHTTILNMLKPQPAALNEALPSDVKPSDTPVCDGHTKRVFDFMTKRWEEMQKVGADAMIKPEALWAHLTKGLKASTEVNEVALLDFGVPVSAVVETLGEAMLHVGDIVVSRVDAQGMKRGQQYKITNAESMPTPFGTYVSYELDDKLWINNGHLLLDPVEAPVKEEAETVVKPTTLATAKVEPKAPAVPANQPKAYEYKTLHLHRKDGKIEKIPLEQAYPKLEPFTKKHFKHPREALIKSHPEQVLKVLQKIHGADVEAWSIPAEKRESCRAPTLAALFVAEMYKGKESVLLTDSVKVMEAFDKGDRSQLELLFPNVSWDYLSAIVNESKTAIDELDAATVEKLWPNIDHAYLLALKSESVAAVLPSIR